MVLREKGLDDPGPDQHDRQAAQECYEFGSDRA